MAAGTHGRSANGSHFGARAPVMDAPHTVVQGAASKATSSRRWIAQIFTSMASWSANFAIGWQRLKWLGDRKEAWYGGI
jgi:hypothetical protein